MNPISITPDLNAPTDLATLSQLVEQKMGEGHVDEALQYQKRVVTLLPRDADAACNLGILQSLCGQKQAAIESYSIAVQLNPDLSKAWFNLGVLLREDDDHLAAIHCNQQVVRIDPRYVDAYNNLAVSYIAIKNFPAAAAAALQSLLIDKQDADSFFHLGIACYEQNDVAQGVAFLHRAVELNPTNNNIRVGLSVAQLGSGDLENGWKNYEYRWYRETAPEKMHPYPYPWWQGESLEGKTILVWTEQGIGDQIMYCSMIPDLARLAGHCIVACAKKLMPLFQRSFPTVTVIDLEDKAMLSVQKRQIDVQSASGSLARWLRPTIESFGNRSSFLVPKPERVTYWKTRLNALGPQPKIGIGWRSGNLSGDRALYCTQIAQWAPIFAVPGVQFINLQYDECAAELQLVAERFGVTVLSLPEVDLFNDLDEAAALTSAMDLVISAPTTTAILASAVGARTWMFISGFSWKHFGTDTLGWCPGSVTISRPWSVPWDVLLASVAKKLQDWVKNH